MSLLFILSFRLAGRFAEMRGFTVVYSICIEHVFGDVLVRYAKKYAKQILLAYLITGNTSLIKRLKITLQNHFQTLFLWFKSTKLIVEETESCGIYSIHNHCLPNHCFQTLIPTWFHLDLWGEALGRPLLPQPLFQ